MTALNTKNKIPNTEFTMKIPVVELSDCIVCGVCVEACREVFRLNDAGYIEVRDLNGFPEEEVNEAIKHCPADCIFWHGA